MIIATSRRTPRWRFILWGCALLLLVLPGIAMQFTAEVRWGPGDFMAFGLLLALACGAFEGLLRRTADRRLRWGGGAAILGLFLLVWAELAVGVFS